jgi:hypothetical protein
MDFKEIPLTPNPRLKKIRLRASPWLRYFFLSVFLL